MPSTFSTYHTGEDWTWTHPKGKHARLDYVVLQDAEAWKIKESYVEHRILTSTAMRDHEAVVLHVEWQHLQGALKKKEPNYDWSKMATAEGQEVLRKAILEIPDPGWEVDVHQHWQCLEDGLHRCLEAPQLGWRQLPQPNTRGHSNNSCGKGSGNRSSSAPQGVGKDNRGRENQSKVGKNSQPEPETYKPTSRGVDYAEPGGPKGQAGKGERRQERRERRQQAKPCGGDNDGGSKSGPDQTDGRTRRGALKKVAELAKSACWVDQARRRLRSRFFSANTRASKNSKRSKVWEIARVVAAGNDVLPLDTDTLEATAATLMESGIKAADQYLGELKGLHIEAGFWWTDKLNHHMAMCKRALSRGRGPEKRAKELKIEA